MPMQLNKKFWYAALTLCVCLLGARAAFGADTGKPDPRIKAELAALIKEFDKTDFDAREAAQKKLLEAIVKHGAPAFQLLEKELLPAAAGNSEAAERLAKVRDKLTQPQIVWTARLSPRLLRICRPQLGKKVVVQTTDHGLYALDLATGAMLWSKPGEADYNGFVLDGVVYWQKPSKLGGDEPVALAAYREDNGAEVWTLSGIYAQEDLLADPKQQQFYVKSSKASADDPNDAPPRQRNVLAVSLKGKLNWTLDFNNLQNLHAPALCAEKDLLVCGIARAKGSPDELQAFSTSDQKLRWTTALKEETDMPGVNAYGNVTCLGSQIYFVSETTFQGGKHLPEFWTNFLVCCEAATGKRKWQVDPSAAVTKAMLKTLHASLAKSKSAGNQSVTTFGGPEMLRTVGAPVPSKDGKIVAVRNGIGIHGLDAATGKLLWSHEFPGYALGAAQCAIENDIVYAGSGTGEIIAVQVADGKIVWRSNFNTLPAMVGAPAVLERNKSGAALKLGSIGDLTVTAGHIYGMTSSGLMFALKLPAFRRTE